MARHLQAPHQHVDDTLDAAIEPRRHLDLGIGGEQQAHQRPASLSPVYEVVIVESRRRAACSRNCPQSLASPV